MDQEYLADELKKRVEGEVRFDKYSKVLYSTDASIYQMEPIGVVIPKSKEDVIATVEIAAKNRVPILPRGGGTGLSGQTVNHAIVLDFSKYLNKVVEICPEETWVRTLPGITLDELNAQMKPHGLQFAPDPTTRNRANVGGAIGNNTCGAHSILYGKTSDNVLSVDAVLSDGSTASFGALDADGLEHRLNGHRLENEIYKKSLEIAKGNSEEIAKRFPKILRRVSGYNLDELLREGSVNMARLLVGSEGTLAVTTEAKLKLVPLPKMAALAVVHFNDLFESMEATVEVLNEHPSAVEMMDRNILDQTRKSLGYARRLNFLEGDPNALLLVEFYGESETELVSRLDDLERRLTRGHLGYAVKKVFLASEQANIWALRSAGLGLLMSVKGDAKPLPFVEDTAVDPSKLPEYVRRFDKVVRDVGTSAAYYGHASVGCLHIRPLINLKLKEGVNRMASIADRVSDLVLEFGGSLSGEHGDGIVRGVWNEKMFGTTLYNAFRELKQAFDPKGIMNPGKITDCPPMTENLRYGPSYKTTEIKTLLDFSKDGSFAQSIELCNGQGVCRKTLTGTMCPSYIATRDEEHSTRGRANALRAAMSGLLPNSELTSRRMYEVLDLCLECKACKSECPSNVDMAKLKYEFLYQYYKENTMPLRTRMFENIDTLSAMGSFFAPVSNWFLQSNVGKWALERYGGIEKRRTLPPYSQQTFTQWFKARTVLGGKALRPKGKIILFHDTYTNYNYPRVGIAATNLLEKMGYDVELADVKCCGRPMISKGLLDKAVVLAHHNVNTLYNHVKAGTQIIGLEPSCLLSFRDDYLDLLGKEDTAKAKAVAESSFLLDEFLAGVAQDSSKSFTFNKMEKEILVHGHCHQKSLVGNKPTLEALKLIPGIVIKEIDSGCCGMAGAFGYEKEHYNISMQIGEDRLMPAIRSAIGNFDVLASGVSCRQQIEHGTGKSPKHLAELMLEAMG